MLFFETEKVLRFSTKVSTIVDVFELLTFKIIPKNRWDKYYIMSQKDFSGLDFIINPKPVLKLRRTVTDREIAEYFLLCGMRRFSDYQHSGDTTLPLVQTKVKRKRLIQNSLLTIDRDIIKFNYEDDT